MSVRAVEGTSAYRQTGYVPSSAIPVPARGAVDLQNPAAPRQTSTPASQGTVSSEPSSPGRSWGIPVINSLHLRIAALATTIISQNTSTSPDPSVLVPSAFTNSRRGSASSQIAKDSVSSASPPLSQGELMPEMDLAFDPSAKESARALGAS